jgi:REP element-mobilizing transposase RayT
MIIEEGKYYHIYNRSNNNEIVFKEEDNYDYFLKKYHLYCDSFFKTEAYCLMPTHFHFLVRSQSNNIEGIRKSIALLLSSYTKAINKRMDRHGSLFQSRTKAKEIIDDSYLITLISYIHQNPIRVKLVNHLDDWQHSSYQKMIQMNHEEWMKNDLLSSFFDSSLDFRIFSEKMIECIKKDFWI